MNRKKSTIILLSVFLLASNSVTAREVVWKIKKVRFSGNQFYSEDRLHRLMVCRPSGFLSPRNYHDQVLLDDIKNIELFYQQNGFLEAEIQNYSVLYDSLRMTVQILIQLNEGVQTKIESISLLGNTFFTDSLLLKSITLPLPCVFSRKRIESTSLQLLTFYANHGFLDTGIESEVHLDTTRHEAVVDYIINEHHPSRIQNINIAGLEKTRKSVVSRELSFKTNEMIVYQKLLDSQKRLYLTGLFNSVFIRPAPTDSMKNQNRDILIELKEKESITLNLSAGYGSLDRLRCRFEIQNQNIGGRSHRAGFSFYLSSIERGAGLAFTEPWTFGTRLQTDVRVRAEYRKEPSYHLNQYGGFLTLGQKLKNKYQVSLTYRRDYSSLSHVRTSEYLQNLKNNINSIKLDAVYDSRNNLFNPGKGFYFQWSNEAGRLFSSSSRNFYRTILIVKGFHSLYTSTIIASGLELGWITASGGLSGIPLQERFFTGGPNSIRGFRYQQVGPRDENGNPYGGQFELIMNILEIRRTIHRSFGMAAFLDAGNVWKKTENFHISDMRISPGIGIRINTVIGTARFDVAFNPFPNSDEPKILYIFNMGQAF